jgi:hypothetical protein
MVRLVVAQRAVAASSLPLGSTITQEPSAPLVDTLQQMAVLAALAP